MILYSPDNFETKDPFGIFEEVVHITHKNQLKTDGVLILWGGEDIGKMNDNLTQISHTLAYQFRQQDVLHLLYIPIYFEVFQ